MAAPLGSAESVPPLHMRQPPEPSLSKRDSNSTVELVVTNNCTNTIYPAITTQSGSPPEMSGFELAPGNSVTVHVPANWQGRVWGRTNCSFPNPSAPASACSTGDCGGVVNCTLTVRGCRFWAGPDEFQGVPPATLAEFTFAGSGGNTFYDISLVDGFNIGMAIMLFANGASEMLLKPSSQTNPSCVASLAEFLPNWNPYGNSSTEEFLGTNESVPLPFVSGITDADVSQWCPWDLQLFPPQKPGDGVYAYPDDNIQRPIFQPCYSTCAKYNQPVDCCTGSYGPGVCKPGLYSQSAKKICPDAYTYGSSPASWVRLTFPAYDDRYSTFTSGPGVSFEVFFCPPGKSTTILANASLASRALHGLSTSSASAEGVTVPWIFAGLALLAVAIVFSTL